MMLAMALALMLAPAGAATATDKTTIDTRTGNFLLTLCAKYPDDLGHNGVWTRELACAAYIRGFVDATTVSNEMLGGMRRGVGICLPETATYDQHTRVTIKYLRDHPETLHEPSGLLVFRALMAAYPCSPVK